MNNFGSDFNSLISQYISSYKDVAVEGEESRYTYVGSETIGEVIEKLLILNIRVWILEDLAALAKSEGSNEQYISLKRKLDVCFKVKRPNLMDALNKMLKVSLQGEDRFYVDDNVKLYKYEQGEVKK